MVNYFTHDSNARNSDKLIPLRAKMGAEGYGIYFMLLERLREEPDYTSVKDYNMLAFDLRVDAAKVKAVVENFGLFAFTDDGKCFYSDSFLRRMQVKDEKSEKARASARSRWGKCERNANAMRTHENSDAIKEKESKEKKIKRNTLSVSPSQDSGDTVEVPSDEPTESERESFFKIFFFKNFKNPAEQVERFVNHYKANGWTRNSGAKIFDRIALARSWEPKDETQKNRFQQPFLQFWGKLYELAEKTGAPESAALLLYDIKAIKDDDNEITLFISSQLMKFLQECLYRAVLDFSAMYYPNKDLRTSIIKHTK